MKYENIRQGVFVDRPNRFIANIEVEGEIQVCHVKNTGRCRELLTPGARVLVQDCASPTRKTRWDLISVWKGERLINMDAAAPNRVFGEWLAQGGLVPAPDLIRPESRFGASRLDFYVEAGERRAFVEVKGVTLEEDGVVRFPDAPTQRGVKHLRELMACVEAGYEAYAAFVIQMKGVERFEPNWKTHPEFGEALRAAAQAGVGILAMDCFVTEDSIAAGEMVRVVL